MKPDHFAQLGQPRRPWIEEEVLKEALHALAALHHPDVAGAGPQFASINAAYAQLRDPAQRIRHLLELEAPEILATTLAIPEDLADSFMRIAALCRSVDDFLKQLSSAQTPLAQALLAGDRFDLQRDVEQELQGLGSAQARVEAATRAADLEWGRQGISLAPSLLILQQEFLYLQKWAGQLREALFHLQASVA